MAHQTETLDGMDVRTIQDRIHGWILAQTAHAAINAQRIMFETHMTEAQAQLGLAKAQEDDLLVTDGPETWKRAWIPF